MGLGTTTIYRLLAASLLAGVAAHRYATVRRTPDVSDYHRRVREAAARVPGRIGGWVGEDVPVPAQAIKVLDPNVIISRRYLNVENGATAGVLFVHCSDAHDMAGHFPLRCYPARGWDVKAKRPRDWAVGGLLVTGSEYEFTAETLEGRRVNSAIVVENFLLRPGGRIMRDMDAMTRSVVGAGGQSSGAGQLQVYFDASVPEAQRDAAVAALVEGYRPVVDAVLAEAVGGR
jgi:hypothetical protein